MGESRPLHYTYNSYTYNIRCKKLMGRWVGKSDVERRKRQRERKLVRMIPLRIHSCPITEVQFNYDGRMEGRQHRGSINGRKRRIIRKKVVTHWNAFPTKI